MSTWKPEDPRILEDKIKSEHKYLARNKVSDDKTILFTDSDSFEYRKHQPQDTKIVKFGLPEKEGKIHVTPQIYREIQGSDKIKNEFPRENPLKVLEKGSKERINLQTKFYRAMIETSDDVAEMRWIQYRWFNFLMTQQLGEHPRDLEAFHMLKEQSGYLYKKAQDFMMSNSINERTETLEELSSRI